MNAIVSLIPLVEANPALVLLEPAKFDQFFEEVAREVRSHVPDLTTGKGREAIASLAMKVSKTKTAIDDARELLTKEKRDEIKKVDAAGKVIRDRLDALRDEVKKPLLDWRAAEEKRVADCKVVMDAIKRDAIVTIDDNAETVDGRLDLIRSVEITEAKFGEHFPIAKALRDTAIEALVAAHARLLVEEANRAELAKLRAADEERQRREAEQRAAAERAQQIADHIKQVGLGFIGGQPYAYAILLRELEEKVVIDATYGDQQAPLEALRVETLAKVREAFDKDRAEMTASAEREAADKARREAENAASEAALAKDRAHAEALAAEKRRADLAEAARKSEADAARMIQEERARATAAQVAEQAEREANVAHRTKIKTEVKTTLMGLGVGEVTAKAIVQAIVAGEVPHTSISF